MREIRNVTKRVHITQLHPAGFVVVEGHQVKENILLNDLDYDTPKVGDELIITYRSNGDIHGKWVGHKEVSDGDKAPA